MASKCFTQGSIMAKLRGYFLSGKSKFLYYRFVSITASLPPKENKTIWTLDFR